MSTPRTLSQKVWDRHVVRSGDGQPDLLYIDLHLVHEVTSPAGVRRPAPRRAHRPPARPHRRHHGPQRPDRGLDLVDGSRIDDPVSARQMQVLRANCDEFGIACYGIGDPNQGIVHIIGPEQGLTQPGMTIVCGDSHTSTHGAFGALAFGIGTSEVEHVLATQTLPSSARAPWPSPSRATSPPAPPPRTSSSPSSGASAPAAASARSSSTGAPPSGPSPWRAA